MQSNTLYANGIRRLGYDITCRLASLAQGASAYASGLWHFLKVAGSIINSLSWPKSVKIWFYIELVSFVVRTFKVFQITEAWFSLEAVSVNRMVTGQRNFSLWMMQAIIEKKKKMKAVWIWKPKLKLINPPDNKPIKIKTKGKPVSQYEWKHMGLLLIWSLSALFELLTMTHVITFMIKNYPQHD